MKKYDIKTTDTETLKKWYHLMVLGRALDEKAPSYLLQSLGWSYHAPYAGHDGIQLAVGHSPILIEFCGHPQRHPQSICCAMPCGYEFSNTL